MQFLLDENIPVQLFKYLTEAGHDVMRVPVLYPPPQHTGILILKVHPAQADKLIAATRRFLREFGSGNLTGKLIILEESEYHLFA